MENLLIYFIKATGLIGMFYIAYMILLRKETFFSANRWFLHLGLITSTILPLFFITKIIWVEPTTDSFDLSNIPITAVEASTEEPINWYTIAGYVYILGIIILLLKLLFDFYSLSKVLKGKNIKLQENFKLIDINENIAPFSYFKSIVYNSALYTPTELENILEHEKVHSSQKHSVDVLLGQLFCIAFWFNPFIWLYKKAMIQNLEFIADSEASKNILDKKAYQMTLLKITTHQNYVPITNHFYQSLIKKRIIMLNKNQSNKSNSWKYIVVFPALVAFVFLFQIEIVAQEKESPKLKNHTESEVVDLTTFKIEKDLTNLSKDKEIYIDGKKSTKEELDKLNPKEIKAIDVAKISSKSTILVTTKHDPDKINKTIKLIDKTIYINGDESTKEKMDKLDPKEIESIDVINNKNEIQIFTKKWLKSSKEYTFYIDAKKVTSKEYYLFDKKMIESSNGNIDEKTIKIITKNKAKSDDKNTIQSVLKQENPNKPLIIINGEIASKDFNIENIDPNKINSVDVLKGTQAITKYGEKGKNGVIEITTKVSSNQTGFQILQE